MAGIQEWHIAGDWFDLCNCKVPCPCTFAQEPTYGDCDGVLVWHIREGKYGDVGLEGLNVAVLGSFEGNIWSGEATNLRFGLFFDERADERQREALEGIFLGRLGGTPESQFPWVWKPSTVLAVRPVAIDLDHTAGRGWFRAGSHVSVRIREPVAEQETVTCVIPGHDRSGQEVIADLLSVEDGSLEFELSGRCGYEATFDYRSAAA
jgi:hypothetical protein